MPEACNFPLIRVIIITLMSGFKIWIFFKFSRENFSEKKYAIKSDNQIFVSACFGEFFSKHEIYKCIFRLVRCKHRRFGQLSDVSFSCL